MTAFQTIAVLMVLAAIGSYVNYRFLRMPSTIGLTVLTLIGTMVMFFLGKAGLVDYSNTVTFVSNIQFDDLLLHGMLSLLLFAGALHIDLDDLKEMRAPIAVLTTIGVLVATFVTGTLFWLGARLLGFDCPYIYGLLFGALISPTDPIAVLGIIRQVGAPKAIQTKIAGESLFNDGIGVVVFLTVLGIATGEHSPTFGSLALYLLEEVAGGVGLGLLLGWITFRMLRSVDAYQVEVLLTVALATGGYALAESLHVSAPILVVTAGLLIGNQGRDLAMSDLTRGHLDGFWELTDEMLNALLFMLIGLELVVLDFNALLVIAGLGAIVAVLCGRFVSVAMPFALLWRKGRFPAGTVGILIWGGLRGGISIALALSLPFGPQRDLLVAVTYIVVIFSVLVQGLTFGRVVRKLSASDVAAVS
jgi:CPA1 family monovalent cation:H+ antiporter